MLQSINPATGAVVWQGPVATPADVTAALATARAAFPGWAATPLDERIAIARRYADLVKASPDLAALISAETGKLRWETDAEQAGVAGKVAVSIAAHAERTGTRSTPMPFGTATLRHRAYCTPSVQTGTPVADGSDAVFVP